MKRMLALLLGILLAFSFALAEDAAGTPAETEPAETAEDSETTEDYMVPRMFMSMFNSVFSISGDMLRGSLGDEEVDRLVEDYSLTQYESDENFAYYSSNDWTIEAAFAFDTEEEITPDTRAYLWSLYISDEADENAWYIAMYTLNQMISYTYRDTVGTDDVLYFFQTVVPGDKLEFPDGYALFVNRVDSGALFAMLPVSADNPFLVENPDAEAGTK